MQAGRRAGAGATGPGGPRRVGAGSFRRIDPLYEVARLVPDTLQEGLRVHPSRPALEQKTAVGALHRVLPWVDPPGHDARYGGRRRCSAVVGWAAARPARVAGTPTADLKLPPPEAEIADHAARDTQRRGAAGTGAGAAATGSGAPDDR